MLQTILELVDPSKDRDGLEVGHFEILRAEDLPEPYRSLLVHASDMTPTLEAFFESAVHLRVLHRRRRGDTLHRTVLLCIDGSDRPVELGAIEIHLDRFEAPAKEEVLQCWLPLGAILQKRSIAHVCQPQAYFRCQASGVVGKALGPRETGLFGRFNVLLDLEGRNLARAVEILPPIVPAGRGPDPA